MDYIAEYMDYIVAVYIEVVKVVQVAEYIHHKWPEEVSFVVEVELLAVAGVELLVVATHSKIDYMQVNLNKLYWLYWNCKNNTTTAIPYYLEGYKYGIPPFFVVVGLVLAGGSQRPGISTNGK